MSKRKNINIRLGDELNRSLVDFCDKTRRDVPETIRQIIGMFLEAGPDVANELLSHGLFPEELIDVERRREIARIAQGVQREIEAIARRRQQTSDQSGTPATKDRE